MLRCRKEEKRTPALTVMLQADDKCHPRRALTLTKHVSVLLSNYAEVLTARIRLLRCP